MIGGVWIPYGTSSTEVANPIHKNTQPETRTYLALKELIAPLVNRRRFRRLGRCFCRAKLHCSEFTKLAIGVSGVKPDDSECLGISAQSDGRLRALKVDTTVVIVAHLRGSIQKIV